MKPLVPMAALCGALLLNSAAAQTGQPLRAGGLEIFYGIVPAAIVRQHPAGHEERAMHGGVPGGAGQHHLIVSIFDATSRERLTNADVFASVAAPGLAPDRKKLEPMQIASAMTFGNYFSMGSSGPYRIRLEVTRGPHGPAVVEFRYWHPKR